MQRLSAYRAIRSLTTPRPWFVDEAYEQPRKPLLSVPQPVSPVPQDAPKPVQLVHAALSQSPHLDLSTVVSSQTVGAAPGPPLPLKAPQGRRKRGSTYAGESMFEVPGGIWRWTVMAQVRTLCFLRAAANIYV
jgi:hypothetical protein